jgi:esterase FrsA
VARFYLVRPSSQPPLPVVMAWAGIDTWKEEMYARLGQAVLANGRALLLIDMPGVGESPCSPAPTPSGNGIRYSHGSRAAKTSTLPERRQSAATYTPESQEKSRNASSYLMALMAARSRIFGGQTRTTSPAAENCRCSIKVYLISRARICCSSTDESAVQSPSMTST